MVVIVVLTCCKTLTCCHNTKCAVNISQSCSNYPQAYTNTRYLLTDLMRFFLKALVIYINVHNVYISEIGYN